MSDEFVFTENDLITILEQARRMPGGDSDPSALATEELMALTRMGKVAVTRLLRTLIEDGSVECVRKRYVRIDGIVTTRPAYRLRRQHDDDDDERGGD